jgi:repressor LexA
MDTTERQRQVLEFIREYHAEHGYAPTAREIQTQFGFASVTAAVNHLAALERKKLIRRTPGVQRSIVVL